MVSIETAPEYAVYQNIYNQLKVNGVKIVFKGTELELNTKDLAAMGGFSFTSVNDTPDYTLFTPQNAMRCMDYKSYGGKDIQGPTSKIKRYYNT